MEVDRFGVDRFFLWRDGDSCCCGDTSGEVGNKSTSSSVTLRRRELLPAEAGLFVKLNASSKLASEKFILDWDSIILEKKRKREMF